MKNDLISIIIPVYKVEKYLEKCIESVLKQTYTNLQIILVDDGSPDNCGKICDEYAKKDSRIEVIHKANGGLSDARNVGISKAKGRYIGFVDSDDYIKEDMYEILLNLIKKYELENQIEKAKQRKVWLNCGGFITIDPTEALVAIDVNSGKYTGKNTLEEAVYKVNYEATIEIAKQLRLRDIGGIIIIDYIDMKDIEHKEKIEKLLKETLKQDRAKTQVEGFTKLNLMELTRKHICAHNS